MYYAYRTVNMMIQLDRNANAVSEAFSTCCAPLINANCWYVCGCVFISGAMWIHLNCFVSKNAPEVKDICLFNVIQVRVVHIFGLLYQRKKSHCSWNYEVIIIRYSGGRFFFFHCHLPAGQISNNQPWIYCIWDY